ncbi:MAG TPA: DMT family transporter, partial [Methylomirabilota bacterium]|nr:DMT family transporter [Methylomirabilota bacterium]
MSSIEWWLLLTLSALWGGSFFFAKVAVQEIPPLTLVLGRVGIAAVALGLFVRAAGYRLGGLRVRGGAFLVMGLLNNLIPFSLLFWSQTRIGSGLAAILNATTPLFAVTLAPFVTPGERLTASRLSGVLAGLLGVLVLVGPDALRGLGHDGQAQLACLAASCSYAVAGFFGHRFRGDPPLVTAAGQVTATAVMVLPIAVLVERPWQGPMPSLAAWSALAGLATLSTALAYIIYFRVLATAGATNLLLVTFL